CPEPTARTANASHQHRRRTRRAKSRTAQRIHATLFHLQEQGKPSRTAPTCQREPHHPGTSTSEMWLWAHSQQCERNPSARPQAPKHATQFLTGEHHDDEPDKAQHPRSL